MGFTVRNTTALVTGASSGIGEAFARQLADHGADVVLVARRVDRLEELARDLRERTGRSVTVAPTDLQEPGAARRLADTLTGDGIRIDVLVNNAGFAEHGLATEADPDRSAAMVAVNVAAVVDLTQAFLPAMVARGHGGIINVASTAAYQPLPYMALYAATKAFVLNYTEAIWRETQGTGVRVLAISPGATQTELFDRMDESARVGNTQAPEDVVRLALAMLTGAGSSPSAISGRRNALTTLLPRILPRRATLTVANRIMRPASATG